jgi:hypothetical protein
MSDGTTVNAGNPLKRLFYRPPYIGLLAFVIVFFVQAIGHTVMIMMQKIFGEQYVYHSAVFLGLVGAVMLIIGMRSKSEVAATWLGFFAGTFLWTGWVEFSFVAYAAHLGIEPRIIDDTVSKPEYLVMPSSLGVLLATLVFFMANKETKCNFFRFFQRYLGMHTGKPSREYERNFAAITALETIYITWFCYIALIMIWDPAVVGYRHPVAYVLFFANTVWALYLIRRLMQFWKVTAAIRYGIATAIIAWNSEEFLGRWHVFTEAWLHPQEYWLEMTLIFVAFLAMMGLFSLIPQHARTAFDTQGDDA